MLQTIQTWILSQNFMVSVATVAISLNLFLSGISLMLQKIDEALKGFMDKTSTEIDNKAQAKVKGLISSISKITNGLQKASDWLSGNRAH